MGDKKKRKVLYLLHTTQWHGANISFYNMLRGLQLDTDLVGYVFIPINQKRKNTDFVNKLKKTHCKIIYGFIGYSVLPKNPTYKDVLKYILNCFFRVISLFQLFFVCLLLKPKIVHTNVGIIQDGYFISKMLHIRHIWHLREYQDLDFNWKIVPSKKQFCKRLKNSFVIAISQDIAQHFGLENNYEVIYNPIFENICSLNNTMNKKKYFLISNRISREKGIEDILVAFQLLKNKEYRLLIAGDGNVTYKERLVEMCRNLGIANRVTFLGYVSDLSVFQSEAVALLVGSFCEGFGRMTVEAIMRNTLVIGRNTGGTREIIEKTHGGFLFNTIEELKLSLELVSDLVEENKYKDFVMKASKKAIDIFSYQKSIDAVRNIYNRW